MSEVRGEQLFLALIARNDKKTYRKSLFPSEQRSCSGYCISYPFQSISTNPETKREQSNRGSNTLVVSFSFLIDDWPSSPEYLLLIMPKSTIKLLLWWWSSSSSRATSTDIPDPLSPLLLSFIAFGWSSGLHPVSSHSCCVYVLAGHAAFARPYVGVHRSTSLMSSSLLLQQCWWDAAS